MGLSRTNGTLASLAERGTGARLVLGELGCLWGARAADSSVYVGGCSYRPAGPDHFAYSWNQRLATLTMTYTSDPAAGEGISATATLSAHGTFFDLRLTLENNRHGVLSSVLFPADLLGPSATATAGYAPNFLPGVRLGPGFFSGGRDDVLTYPSRWAFADYLAADLAGGHFALYSVNPAPRPLQPVDLGFVRAPPPALCSGRVFCITHSFDTWIRDGSTWTSPLIRVRVAESVERTIVDYRHDNGIDLYPSLADKLGAALTTYAQAPLIKADVRKGLPPFSDWEPELRRLPSPALLHPVAFQPGGHDANDPDFLPPDPTVGTAGELRSMIAQAHALGLPVMPYLNVSWWNLESPTVRGLPAGVDPQQFAVLNASGQPLTGATATRRATWSRRRVPSCSSGSPA